MKSKIGHISLIIAVSGLVLTEIGIHVGLLKGIFWRVLATGFEAGTIGALADWFAVSALFHHIPLPLIGRHTNIIVKNRNKLTEAIVELVTTQWLSAAIIHQKLEGVEIAKGVFRFLERQRNLDRVVDSIRQVLLQLISNIDSPPVVANLQGWFREQVSSADIAAPLGGWLEKMVIAGEHQPLVNRLLDKSARALDESSTRAIIHDKLRGVLASYEQQDFIKKAAVKIGRWTGGIDIDVLTDRLLNMIREMADEAQADPHHPLRETLDTFLLELGEKLKKGDGPTLIVIDRLKQQMLENLELQAMFLALVIRAKTVIQEQLNNNETALMDFFNGKAKTLIDMYGSDEALLLKMDHWIKQTVAQLVNKHHHEVGNLVRESLLRLDDRALVVQIKEKVGDDLQYIRLNGAVVGGLVGILIAMARLLFLH